MYKHILVPVVFDHGDHGKEALDIADHLLEDGGKITLLHVMEDVPAYAAAHIPEGIREHHRQDATNGLNALGNASTATTETAVIHGHSSTSILEYAKNHGSDCIVIASHKPGMQDYFIGSTAARVVRHAKCAVHIMR